MQGSSYHNYIDYFKLFKIYDLKKIEKTGIVKIVQDKVLNRKVLSVEGNISTANYINFPTNAHPNIPFSQRYLYVLGFVDSGKSFCMQISYNIGNKHFKAVYSTLYKVPKKHLENIIHLPIGIVPQKWNVAVIDLYELGIHFGLKPQQLKLMFKVTGVEVRASSKVKSIFQSDYLFSVDRMPKELMLPLRNSESFFEKYHYVVVSTDEALLKEVSYDHGSQNQILQSRKIMVPTNDKSKSRDQKKPHHAKSTEKKILLKQQNSIADDLGKNEVKNKSKQKDKNNKSSISAHSKRNKPPVPKNKQKPKQDNHIIEDELDEVQPQQQQMIAPKPQGHLALSLSSIEGYSLNKSGLTTVQSYILNPTYMPTHKPIQTMIPYDQNNVRVLTAYVDGSICIWDTVRRQSLSYFMTQLAEIRVMLVDESMTLVLIGLDKLKREVINIISNNSVIFRQISNYNIFGAILISSRGFEEGLLSFGYENIRLWRVNSKKGIIQGTNIYLGNTNRKVKYTSSIILHSIHDTLAFVVDSVGFITTISISQAKMLQSIKIDPHPIDLISLLPSQGSTPRALISNELGVLKIINIQKMQLLEELNINSRIKQIHQTSTSDDLILTHYNKSIGSLNLESGMYSFLMRAHTAPVTKIIYSPQLNKVVSMSKDNSLRIWQYVANNNGSLPFRLQEQYEFLITGEEILDGVSPLEGKAEDIKYVVVGGDSGKLRRIDIENYVIKQEVILEEGKMSISMSRNGKYIICTYQSGNTYLLDNTLAVLFKYPFGQGQSKRVKHWKNGFNSLAKQYFLENLYEERIEFYELKNMEKPLFCLPNQQISSIEMLADKEFIIGGNQLRIYERDVLMQMISFDSSETHSLSQPKLHALKFPIIAVAIGDKLVVRALMTQLEQHVQLPENINHLTIDYNEEKQEGLVFCAGSQSHALYVISYQLHNVQFNLSIVSNLGQTEMPYRQSEQNQMEISFSQTTFSAVTTHPIKNSRKTEEHPKELKKLYAEEQQLYEQVKDYLFPKAMPQPQEEEYVEQVGQNLQFQQNEADGINVLLQYGYQVRQQTNKQNGVGTFCWLGQNNSMLMLAGNGKDILQHFFTVPIKHKVASFPATISSFAISPHPYESIRYVAISVNSLIKIYNAYEQLSYIRTIESLSSAQSNNFVYQSAITNCNRYLLTLSYNQSNIDSKIYIHLIEISTSSVVSSSYLSLPPPKNKHKKIEPKDIKQYRLLINPYKTALEFIIYNPSGILHFYRITSILTLQTMQLEELQPLCRDKVGTVTSACFINVGEEKHEDAVIALGSDNGSVVFIDSRSANILIACVGLLPHASIASISYTKGSEQDASKLILFTNSTNLFVYNLHQGLNSILTAMDNPKATESDSKQLMTLDGQVTAHSNIQHGNQQLVVTKCGSLWLLDYDDLVTVKVSSIHTAKINKAQIVSTQEEAFLFTAADDGCLKISNIVNLEQSLEIYKPRRQARTFNLEGRFTLMAFSDELFIYSKIDPRNMAAQLTSLGSIKVDQPIIDLKNIPSTDNYYLLTKHELLMVYLSSREVHSKSQITIKSISRLSQQSAIKSVEVQAELQKITDLEHPQEIVGNDQFAPYQQFALLTKPGKVTIWSRKCLKRNFNPLDQLANVHELSYYLIDSTSRNSNQDTSVKFISQYQYVWGLLEEGIVQVRNYREHAIVSQINFSLNNLTALHTLGSELFTFIAGDSSGNVYILNQNGLLIDRVKALQYPVSSINLWRQETKSRLVVSGGNYVSIVSNINLKL